MTIPAVTAGELIDPTTFGNAVADQLNALPARIVNGASTVTTTSVGVATITHGLGFTPDHVSISPLAPASGADAFSGASGITWNSTQITITRCINPVGNAITSKSVSFRWIAFKS